MLPRENVSAFMPRPFLHCEYTLLCGIVDFTDLPCTYRFLTTLHIDRLWQETVEHFWDTEMLFRRGCQLVLTVYHDRKGLADLVALIVSVYATYPFQGTHLS